MTTSIADSRARRVSWQFGLRPEIAGFLAVPPNACGVVLFAHGSGSSRHSSRNQYVADVLQEGGMATLLIDLLTPVEEARDDITGELRFDVDFLADRLLGASEWLARHPSAAGRRREELLQLLLQFSGRG